MNETCFYDDLPVYMYELCEDCYSVVEALATCEQCGTDERVQVIQGIVNAYYHCTRCGDNWM